MTPDSFADRQVRLAVAMTFNYWKRKWRPTKEARLGKIRAVHEAKKRREAGK